MTNNPKFKFKIGDKVKILKSTYQPHVGKIGPVVETKHDVE